VTGVEILLGALAGLAASVVITLGQRWLVRRYGGETEMSVMSRPTGVTDRLED
jgi:hypothetical protein